MADLTFIRSGVHRHLAAEMLEAVVADADVSGLMVSGSVARGDAAEGSDLDLYVLLKKGAPGIFIPGITPEFFWRSSMPTSIRRWTN
ncbi:nucleotidyltransferase domain-containing protein [Paenibacillus sp. GYB004]|uniref:nucleotidyltransferase domain-containing protein n=1 Tax=Paenibacillus sp. GYB004 TaxID=2994393 RepID=UPI002F965799